MSATHNTQDDVEYLYTVLNLPSTASDHELRERYMQLSVKFHPDKQLDPAKKDAATKQFFEIQKAYEVLSDPLRRQAYDLLGNQGSNLLKSLDADGLSKGEIKSRLLAANGKLEQERLDQLIKPRGRATLALDASSVVDRFRADVAEGSDAELPEIKTLGFSVHHSVEKQVRQDTTVSLSARVDGTSALLGTVRHQFSPRFHCQATTNLLRPGSLRWRGSYRQNDYTVTTQIALSPKIVSNFFHRWRQPLSVVRVPALLPVNLAFSRRLFPASNAQGIFTVSTMSTQVIDMQLSYLSDLYPFDFSAESDQTLPFAPSEPVTRIPSRSGLLGQSFWRIGLGITGLLPTMNAEYVLNFSELNVQVKSVLVLGLTGITAVLGAGWTSEDNRYNVSTDVQLSAGGVALLLDFSYLYQRFQIPITLSHDYDPDLAFWTALLPTTAFVLGYHFLLKPQNRKRRLEYFRQARRELKEAQSDTLRQHEETVYLLGDIARQHMAIEAKKDGLVIQEAWYGPSERGEDCESLDVNVTIPVQVLMNKSQLYIPGRRSKAGLQGFYDPVPGIAKSLRIRYTFRGRQHYAELPDYLPVVLPLKEHLVD